MKIGLSCTVWAGGERAGHLDGIGTYSRALWGGLNDLTQQTGDQLIPYAFGRDLPHMACGTPRQLAERFPVHALLSGILKLPLANSRAIAGEVELFHATDHHIPRIAGVPTVATVMDVIPMLHPKWIKNDLRSLKSWLFKTAIRKADHIITISEYSKQDMVEHLGIAPSRISVTPLGVEPVYFERIDAAHKQAVLDKHGLKPGFFLFVGTLQPRKNLPRILQAFKQLPATVRQEHPLVIVGRDGWNNEELLPQLTALQQQGEGRWLSYLPQDEVMALLQSAAALTFPSLYEGFGLPVIEAFAAQCPVLASNSTSVPEVAGDASWAVDPYDVDSISSAMQALLEQDALRDEKVRLGLERAHQYTWKECARQTLEIYRQVRG
ncbi:TPA: glycosyltransferase family 4 protein [Pseudomonas putida]|nr:glycosyltransferase family 4 protein [Pseudomonas aeruginosa]HCF5338674.1 glycosyltransferase family 4 protein [Pseudomonas aeruginosa]HDS1802305.1 glycosyltransferase family 4 protein [Pseudomonas putida]HDS1808344.1 glycosyltransferase family 4 protein [Pseudomonas putida]